MAAPMIPINPKSINGISFYLPSKYESLGIRNGLASPHGLEMEDTISWWVNVASGVVSCLVAS